MKVFKNIEEITRFLPDYLTIEEIDDGETMTVSLIKKNSALGMTLKN